MARLPRLNAPRLLHLVVLRAQADASVFDTTADRQCYLDALAAAVEQGGAALHAYGLMPLEARLLLTPEDSASVGQIIQAIGRRHVPHFNRKTGRSGSPWQGRFCSTVVEASAHFLECLQFVEASMNNADESDLSRSSAAHHLGMASSPLIREHPAFWSLGNTPFDREDAYRQMSRQGLSTERQKTIRDAATKGWPLGSAHFLVKVENESGRRVAPLKRGRPRMM